MCVAAEEEFSGSSVGDAGAVPEILVTAPRIGLDLDVYGMIDWAEAGKAAGIGALGGVIAGGNLASGVGGAISAGAAAAEAQPGVDLEDLFVIENDMIFVRGGYLPYQPIY